MSSSNFYIKEILCDLPEHLYYDEKSSTVKFRVLEEITEGYEDPSIFCIENELIQLVEPDPEMYFCQSNVKKFEVSGKADIAIWIREAREVYKNHLRDVKKCRGKNINEVHRFLIRKLQDSSVGFQQLESNYM